MNTGFNASDDKNNHYQLLSLIKSQYYPVINIKPLQVENKRINQTIHRLRYFILFNNKINCSISDDIKYNNLYTLNEIYYICIDSGSFKGR